MDPSSTFSFRERLLIVPFPSSQPSNDDQLLHVRMESTMTVRDDDDDGSHNKVTPFPRLATQLLQKYNTTKLQFQIGTSSSRNFGSNPLDSVEPWCATTKERLDLGPSGVLVRASFRPFDDEYQREAFGRMQFEALLQEMVARRLLLAPLFSVSIRRLHRHIQSTVEADGETTYELVLPMEGSALSSEGMHAFATALAPCHNTSGIFSWNDPLTMSEFFVKRNSTARHSIWMQLDEQLDDNSANKLYRIVKGMQIQPQVVTSNSDALALVNIFPASTRHRRCPFVQSTTLEAIQSGGLENVDREGNLLESQNHHSGNTILRQEWSPKHWKDPFLQSSLPATGASSDPPPPPLWSVYQTLQRPRGVAYTGRLVTQVMVQPSPSSLSAAAKNKGCHVRVDLQWFLPPIVQPTWRSLRVVWEQTDEQIEQELDFRHDLGGEIQFLQAPTVPQQQQEFAVDPTLHFRIPMWNVTSLEQQNKLTISLDYRPAFLSFEHFPGDANRGVEVPPAIAKFLQVCPTMPTSTTTQTPIHLFSNSLLLLPPVPDMSMPFNVLSMTCSLYAFIVGSLLNLLIRKSSERVQKAYDPNKKEEPSKLKKLIMKIKRIVQRKRSVDVDSKQIEESVDGTADGATTDEPTRRDDMSEQKDKDA